MFLSTLKLVGAIVVAPFLFLTGSNVDGREECICDESYDHVIISTQVVEEETESAGTQLYSVNGASLSVELQIYLYEALKRNGIDWWYTYALCQMYQESKFNLYAVNQQNHEDMGLFQYKIRFWPSTSARYGRAGADIFDPYAQIDVYSAQIRERLERNGWDNAKTISDHFTGGYGYSAQYVSDVLQWSYKITIMK